jgi:pSer/pThr/pTyr-binding forkhead associated (FHA) protein
VPQARRSVPPPLRGGTEHPAPTEQSPGVFILYQGQRYSVTKERFVIGRGRQSSDLTIKDPNVSRQHAMLEFHKGQYYMVDMGSTNGIEYGGQRVQRRVVNEGDTFYVCDHELRFSFS